MIKVIAVLVVLCLFQAEARPDGATMLACATLIPEHGPNQAGNDTFPYKVDLSGFSLRPSGYGYKAGEKYCRKVLCILYTTKAPCSHTQLQ